MYVVHSSSSSSSSNKRRSFFFFFSSFHTTNCQGTEYGVPRCVIPKLTPQNCATPYRGRPFPPSVVTSAKRWGREQVKTLVFGSCKMCACATPCTLQALDRFVLALPVCSLFSLSLFFFSHHARGQWAATSRERHAYGGGAEEVYELGPKMRGRVSGSNERNVHIDYHTTIP